MAASTALEGASELWAILASLERRSDGEYADDLKYRSREAAKKFAELAAEFRKVIDFVGEVAVSPLSPAEIDFAAIDRNFPYLPSLVFRGPWIEREEKGSAKQLYRDIAIRLEVFSGKFGRTSF